MNLKSFFPLIGIFLYCATAALADDPGTKYKVGKDLTISFPGIPDTVTTKDNFVTSLHTGSIYYVATSNTADFSTNIGSKKDFDFTMEKVLEGYLNDGEFNSFRRRVIDTVFDKSLGKYLHLYSTSDTSYFKEVIVFLTLQDSRFYSIQVFVMGDLSSRDAINAFFNSAKFHGKNYTSGANDAVSFGRAVGNFLIPVAVIAGVIVFIVILINRNNRRNRNRELTGSL